MSHEGEEDATDCLNEGVVEWVHAVVESFGGHVRVGQDAMATLVDRAMETGGHAFVQAGTGTGKSVAYLVPALRHSVMHDRGPTVIATATLALQRQLIARDIPAVVGGLRSRLPRDPRVAVLKGRNNYVCLQRLHGGVVDDESESLFAFEEAPRSGLGEQARRVRQWAESTDTGDRDDYPDSIDPRVWRAFSVNRRECVGESSCAFGAECFTAQRRTEALEADIVVTNHALLAIEAIEKVPVLPEYTALVIDEAHELVDRLTSAARKEISASVVERSAARAKGWIDDVIATQLLDASEALHAALVNLGADREVTPLETLPSDVLLALTLVRDATKNAMSMTNKSDASSPELLAAKARALGALEEVHEIAGSLVMSGANDVVWATHHGTPTLHRAPLDLADDIRSGVCARSSVTWTSATLTTGNGFDHIVRSMGLFPDDPSVQVVDVGSPFDYSRQGILYVASDLPAPGREGVAMEALDVLAELIEAAGGRTLALFSSWRGVERAADYLQVRLSRDFPLLVQRKGDAVAPLVQAFADDERSVLLGTVSLWQGVDVPGRACTLVVIDRIPFPRPDDPLMNARVRAVESTGGSGFAAVTLPKASLLLAQGAGRLIRGEADRGVVAVLDPRLATATYARTLRAGLPPLWFTTDKESVLGALRRVDQGEGSDRS